MERVEETENLQEKTQEKQRILFQGNLSKNLYPKIVAQIVNPRWSQHWENTKTPFGYSALWNITEQKLSYTLGSTHNKVTF